MMVFGLIVIGIVTLVRLWTGLLPAEVSKALLTVGWLLVVLGGVIQLIYG